MGKNNHHNNGSSSNTRLDPAQLAILGSFLSTVGDAISTYAAIVAKQSQNNNNEDRIKKLEKQVQFLKYELKKLNFDNHFHQNDPNHYRHKRD